MGGRDHAEVCTGAYVDGYGYGQHDALSWLEDGSTLGWFSESAQRRAWVWCLAHNLSVAAGLCRAFTLGAEYVEWREAYFEGHLAIDAERPFVPGHGKEAP